MKTPPMWRRYLRFRGPDVDADVDDELRFHLEARTEELIRSGMEPEAARAEAMRRFGDVNRVRRACRDIGKRREKARRRTEYFGELRQDMRYAWRTLRKNPGFTAVAVLTLALGIGANTAIFSVVNSVLLRPLTYQEPEELVSIQGVMSVPGMFLAFRDRVQSFEGAALYNTPELSLTGRGDPVRLQGARTSSGLFSVLGVDAVLGRTFLPGEDQPGSAQVVVLSYGLWQQRFGADPDIIGQPVRIDGETRTVIGVMPADFRFPSRETRLWVPMVIDTSDPTALWGMGGGYLVARLREGATVEQASARVATLAPRLGEEFPWDMSADFGKDAHVISLQEQVVGDAGPTLLILLGATGLVLLIACVNVANLLLARASARQHELAIRTALGAGRGRLVRQLLTESVLLAVIGGTLGLLLAFVGVEFLTSRLPENTPRLAEIGIDARVLGFTLAVTGLTGIIFGLLPALRASGSKPQAALREGGQRSGTGAGRRRLAGALVTSEIALAVVLVIGAGLLIKSFWRLLQVDPGFRTGNVITATISPPEFRYEDDAARRVFYQELLQRLETLPGVRSTAVATGLPLAGGAYTSVFVIEGRPHPASSGGDWPLADLRVTASEDYFRVMGVPILRGRGFEETDRTNAPRVALINQSLAREFWPDQNPVGERIQLAGDEESWMTIVGVAGNAKQDELTEEDRGAFYLPLLQGFTGPMSMAVRTTADPATFAATLRGIVSSIDEDTPVTDIRTMQQLVSRSVADQRFTMLLLAAFGTIALLLGAVGIYGVLAYAVSQRTREIGVRMALGAETGDVLRMVVRQGLALAGVGIVLGLIAAFAATRVLSSLLYGVSPTDPLTFGAVALLLATAALLASYIPARRATRVNPMIALRAE